jgi:phosphomethylpyrimidine synthase
LKKEKIPSSNITVRPLTGSRKIHIDGSRDDLKVPMREILLQEKDDQTGVDRSIVV